MFTGIVQVTTKIISVTRKLNLQTHSIKLPNFMINGLKSGASVAYNGCCLTVTKINNDCISFDLIKETLRVTNLGKLVTGNIVNIERAAKFGNEIGGHIMSGHIITTAKITKIITSRNNHQIWFKPQKLSVMKYILHKGFIGIDGISLTVGETKKTSFCVYLIPETLKRTTLGINKRLGQLVNIEVDPQTQIIVDTVERLLTSKEKKMTR